MTSLGEKLSAYLDGELSDAEAKSVEDLLEQDADARAEFDALMAADRSALEQFEEMLTDPVPLALASAINRSEEPAPVRQGLPAWAQMAAGFALIALGGFGGYQIAETTRAPVQVASAGWLQDIADYHGIYASETRHLVEVTAAEPDHIETWLGNRAGAEFSIPDLADQGLTFQGGRLLVAAGKPVAQLIYTTDAGEVFALCLRGTEKPSTDSFDQTTIGAFDMVSWRNDGADYVVVGPKGSGALDEMARAAAGRV